MKTGKRKLVRDSFTIPASEYVVLAQIKQRAIQLARPSKKSEVLRAGVMALATMDDKTLLAALEAVPPLKTGRPQTKAASESKTATPVVGEAKSGRARKKTGA